MSANSSSTALTKLSYGTAPVIMRPLNQYRWGRADAHLPASIYPVPHPLGVTVLINTRIERFGLEAQANRMLLHRRKIERLLVSEQPVVILPVLTLFPRTMRRFGRP